MIYVEGKYAPPGAIAYVVRRTGCTKEQAVAELVAEEGDIFGAVFNILSAV